MAERTSTSTATTSGGRRSLTYPNGLTTTYDYHPTLRWLERVRTAGASGTVADFGYAHDDVGNRTSKSTLDWTESYQYDDVYRLMDVARSGATPSHSAFSYDPVGNRTAEQQDGISRSFTHDARNRLLGLGGGGSLSIAGATSEPATVTVDGRPMDALGGNVFEGQVPATGGSPQTVTVEATDPSGNLRTNVYQVDTGGTSGTFSYDPNGNLTSKVESGVAWTYEWNALNQLLRVTKNGAEAARFRYDPLGRRVEKIAGGVTSRWTYDGEDILREARGAVTVTYIHGPGIDEPLARKTATGAFEYIHADGLGSIVKVTDESGNVVLNRQYDAWGNIEVGETEAGHAFTGREWDPETGLYYYRARYYDPKIGRFISEDPIRWTAGPNFYAYVRGRPATLDDPAGLDSFTVSYFEGPGAGLRFSKDPTGVSFCLEGGVGMGGSAKYQPTDGLDPDGVDVLAKASFSLEGYLSGSVERNFNISSLVRDDIHGISHSCPAKDQTKLGLGFGIPPGGTEVTTTLPGDEPDYAEKASIRELGAEAKISGRICFKYLFW